MGHGAGVGTNKICFAFLWNAVRGYTFKAQLAGKRELKAAGECLNYMSTGLADKTAGQQWHRISHRVLQDAQHRCMLRTAPEEVNLSVNAHEQDVTNAEFLRTFRSQEFPGGQLVKRLEHERGEEIERSVNKAVPARKASLGQAPIFVQSFEDTYGFRGKDPRVYYLSPWEFLMQWELEQLQPPSKRGKTQPGGELTKWSDSQPLLCFFCALGLLSQCRVMVCRSKCV